MRRDCGRHCLLSLQERGRQAKARRRAPAARNAADMLMAHREVICCDTKEEEEAKALSIHICSWLWTIEKNRNMMCTATSTTYRPRFVTTKNAKARTSRIIFRWKHPRRVTERISNWCSYGPNSYICDGEGDEISNQITNVILESDEMQQAAHPF